MAALACVAAAGAVAPRAALAGNRAAAWVSAYMDDDGTTILSPQVSARADVRDVLEVSAAYDLDVITAASVDVVTAGSPRGYEEVRHGLAFGLTVRPETGTTLAVRWLPSWEPDYRSDGLSLSASREWLDHRLTTRVGYNFASDLVGRRGTPTADWHPLETHGVALALGLVLDKRTVAEGTWELGVAHGFLASPYRYVRIHWPSGGDVPIAVPEATPGLRIRHALAVSVRRAFGRTLFGSLWYRFYADDWGVTSHAGEVELTATFGADRLLAGLSGRAYWQHAASFYEEHYEAPEGSVPRFRVADKMLSTSWTVMAGGRFEWTVASGRVVSAVRLTARIDLYEQHFADFAPLEWRRALVSSLGVAVEL